MKRHRASMCWNNDEANSLNPLICYGFQRFRLAFSKDFLEKANEISFLLDIDPVLERILADRLRSIGFIL